MKAIVIYYSRSGNTRRVAEKIAGVLSADIMEVRDKKKRAGILGFFVSGGDAHRKRTTEIEYPIGDFSAYDVVFIGTPVWAFTMTPAIRTFLKENSFKGKKIGLFCTTGGTSIEETFREMKKFLPDSFIIGEKGFTARDLKCEGETDKNVTEFVKGA